MKGEKERAEFYQDHKDDPDLWGELEEAPVTAPKNGLAISVTVRFSPEDAEAIRHTAQREQKTYSQLVRAAVERYTHPSIVVRGYQSGIIFNFDTNAPITQSPSGATPFVTGLVSASETRASVVQS